jgi:hypothetical protein
LLLAERGTLTKWLRAGRLAQAAVGGLAILWIGGITKVLPSESLDDSWRALVVGVLLLGLAADLFYRRALWTRRYQRGNRFLTRRAAFWTVLVSGVLLLAGAALVLGQLLR